MSQIQELLKWSIVGLGEGRKQPDRILEKIERVVRGEEPPEEEEEAGPLVSITLTGDQIEIVKGALTDAKRRHDRLPFYLHSVLLIALWSSFEAYLQGVIAEFFLSNKSELASEKQFSARDLLNNTGPVVDYLIERELIDFGHLSLDGMTKYVKNKLKYDFQPEEIRLLQKLYFLRNVAAHNSGFIRASQRSFLPVEITVYENQIEIPKDFLEDAISRTTALARRMDRYLVDNRNVPKSRDSLFGDVPDVNVS